MVVNSVVVDVVGGRSTKEFIRRMQQTTYLFSKKGAEQVNGMSVVSY